MSDHAIYLEPAFVLHSRAYRESSLILDVLTQRLGKVSLLAKAVKNKKNTEISACLQPFNPILVSFYGNTGLRVLSDVELEPPKILLEGKALYCGFYVNELLKYLLHTDDPCPEIYLIYRRFLEQLQENFDNLETLLRFFELQLLEALGYGLQLTHDFSQDKAVVSEKKYHFIPDRGPVESKQGFISGDTLLSLQNKVLKSRQALFEAKKLMRLVFDFYLQGRQLRSRTLIKQLYQS